MSISTICSTGFVLSFDNTTCVDPIEDDECYFAYPDNYVDDNGDYYCQKCLVEGETWNFKTKICDICDRVIRNCDSCG